MKNIGMFCLSVALVCLLAPIHANACGPCFGDDDEDYVHHQFLPQKLLGTQYVDVANFVPHYPDAEAFKRVNLLEWSKILGVSAETAEKRVYHLKEKDTLPKEVRDYLLMVHAQQDLVSDDDLWKRQKAFEETPDLMNARYRDAIMRAEAVLNATSSPGLKLRSLFIAMRLAHYSKAFDVEEELYQKYGLELRRQKSARGTEVWHWIDALRAGRLLHVGKTPNIKAQSALMFARIFQTSVSKKGEAFHNFSVSSNLQWSTLMVLCKDADEQALMHAIRAAKSDGSPVDELLYIAKKYPSSPWTSELLGWIMVSLQDSVLLPPQKRTKPQLSQLRKLREALSVLSSSASPKDPFLLALGSLFVRFAERDGLSVGAIDALQQRYASDERSGFLDGLRIVVFLSNLRKVDAEAEVTLASLLDAFKVYGSVGPLQTLAFKRLAPIYKSQGDDTKHIFAHHGASLPREGLTMKEIEATRDFEKKPSKNAWEVRLVGGGRTDEAYRSAKALRFLKDGQVEKAMGILRSGVSRETRKEVGLRLMRQMNYPFAVEVLSAHATGYSVDDDWRGFGYTPFGVGVGGHNRNYESRVKSGKWTRLRFARRMAELQGTKQKGARDAASHFQYATGLYNTTWFGNSPLLLADYRSTDVWSDPKTTNLVAILKASKAHYLKAYQFSKDADFKAKVLYALAKIELAELRIRPGSNLYDFDVRALRQAGFGEYFTKLNAYKHTQYFKEVIDQCGTYRQGGAW